MNKLISALSEQELQEIDAEIVNLPYPSAAAIDALKIVQNHRGWISDDSLQAIARHLGMSNAELDSIATFYTMIFRRPVGEQVILLCNSVCCWMKGCDKLQAEIHSKLGIAPGETSKDNRYTLIPASCLGDCDHAPVMMVDETLHRDIEVGDIARVLETD